MSREAPLSDHCPITVRPCVPDETDRLLALRTRALRDAPAAFRQTIEEHERVPPAAWRAHFEARLAAGDGLLVAEACGAWVGMVFVTCDGEGSARLNGMWVAPEARGRHVGRALLNAALAWARAADVRRVRLCVGIENAAAVALYSSVGFRATGERCTLRPGSAVEVEEFELTLPPKSLWPPPPHADL